MDNYWLYPKPRFVHALNWIIVVAMDEVFKLPQKFRTLQKKSIKISGHFFKFLIWKISNMFLLTHSYAKEKTMKNPSFFGHKNEFIPRKNCFRQHCETFCPTKMWCTPSFTQFFTWRAATRQLKTVLDLVI